MKPELSPVKQCKACPWRVDCVPDRDIPGGYREDLHRGLKDTISTPDMPILGSSLRIMACHHSKVGKETVCAGWLHNQIGEGNNIGARLAVITGQMPAPEVFGAQHRKFDDTLPKS